MSLAPGWYKDPAEPTTQRWWDGEGWVGDPLPADATPPLGPPPAATPHQPDRGPQVPVVSGMTSTTEAPPRPDGRPPGPPGAVPPLSWRLPAPGSTQVPPRPHGYPLARPSARLLARLVDIGVVFSLNVLVNGWFVYQYWLEIAPFMSEVWRRSLAGSTSVADLPPPGDQAGNLQIVIVVLVAALWFAYEVPAVANTGQTPGKRLLRIKVVRLESGQPLGFGRSFRRWNTMGLPTLLWVCLIGFVLQLVDALFVPFDRPLHQALHDKSAHTAVVVARPATVPSGKERADEPAHPS